MKPARTIYRTFILAAIIALITANAISQTTPYIGQTPPGLTPVRFAPNSAYVTDGSWAWRSAPVFSPASDEMYFTSNSSA